MSDSKRNRDPRKDPREELIREEALEYLFECHEDPDRFEQELTNTDDRRMTQAVRDAEAFADLLREAARGEVADLDFVAPSSGESPSGEHRKPDRQIRRRPPGFFRIAAGFLFLAALIPTTLWGWSEMRLQRLEGRSLRMVVSGPPGIPDGGQAQFRVETWSAEGEPKPARIGWEAYDEDQELLLSGERAIEGSHEIAIPAKLSGARLLRVWAEDGGVKREAELTLSPSAEGPVVHLSTDKPIYRPGEVVRMRSVVLERVSLAPRTGSYRFRIVDPKGAPVWKTSLSLEEGVASGVWMPGPELSGGEYRFELRDSQDQFTVEALKFEVRRFQSPRLKKEVDLDRETYAPGESGVAEIGVERVEGGFPVGATVEANLLVDGRTVWGEVGRLQEEGKAKFTFRVPDDVARGEARFSARITDGGVVETALEPFVVFTGKVEVELFPEGGELLADVENRLYFEIVDPLGRPVHGTGVILDPRDRELASFQTDHQGRGRVEFTPSRGKGYRFRIDTPSPAIRDLPEALGEGVVLRSLAESFEADQPAQMRVFVTEEGPWVVGIFCRGVLVGQDVFQGRGWNEISIPLPSAVAGVLRVTVFDRELNSLAERLVHRSSGRAIEVTLEAEKPELLPGEHQVLEVSTRTESGRPVSAVVGLTVLDRAVRDLAGDVRIGLADQTWLFGDVEELEDAGEFLGLYEEEAARSVDLLLGTRGWRKFAWRDPERLVVEHEDRARRLLVLEGRPQIPLVHDDLGNYSRDRSELAFGARQKKRIALLSLLGFGVLCLAYWVARGAIAILSRVLAPTLPGRGWVMGLSAAGALIVLLGGTTVVLVNFRGVTDGAMPAARVFDMAAVDDRAIRAQEAIGVELEEKQQDFLGFPMAAGEPERIRRLRRGEPDDVEGLDYFLGEGDGALAAGLFFDDDVDGDLDEAAPVQEEEVAPGEDDFNFRAGRHLGKKKRFDPRGMVVRVYAHRRSGSQPSVRRDFTEVLYWNPLLKTAADGKARVEFDLSDSVTTFVAQADAHGRGRVGQGEIGFRAVPPFYLEAKLPVEVSDGDTLELPVAVVSSDPRTPRVLVEVAVEAPLTLTRSRFDVTLTEGRGRVQIPLSVSSLRDLVGEKEIEESKPLGGAVAKIAIVGRSGGFVDRIVQRLRIVPRGFPHRVSRSGLLREVAEFSVAMPEDYVPGTLNAELKLFPSPLSDLLEGMEGMLRTPCGCFEQASSANYPNVMVLRYLRAAGVTEPTIEKKVRGLLESGYQRLTGYECSKKGYEWFGGDPGHESLTAYGLLEFHDMSEVFDVDPDMLSRTRRWLLDRRDGKGGFQRNEKALDSFGRAPQSVTNAYVTYALAVTGEEPANLEAELDRLEGRALESEDPYEVALASLALFHAGRSAPADGARERLKTMQREDGGLASTTRTITCSGGRDLEVETTSFAVLAWLVDEADGAAVERAVAFLLESRSGGGTFGATQATIMALKALTEYADSKRRVAHPGNLRIFVNDYEVRSENFAAGRRNPFVFGDLAGSLSPGPNRVRMELTGKNEFPWAFDLSYRGDQPASDPETKVVLRTRFRGDGVVREGDPISLEVGVENRTNEGIPMVVAMIGLPAGVEVTTEVLEDLRGAGRFDFYERRGRDLALYWRSMAPSASASVNLDVLARVPGTSTGAASRAWLYYTPQQKSWTDPLRIEVAAENR